MRNLMIYRIMTILGGALLLVATIFVLVRWQNLPSQIPTHFNFAGEADAYGGKGAVIFEIITGWVVFILLTIIVKFPKTWNMPFKVTPENSARLYGITRGMLEIVKLLTALLFVIIMISAAMNTALPQILMIAITASLLATVAVGIFLMYRNR